MNRPQIRWGILAIVLAVALSGSIFVLSRHHAVKFSDDGRIDFSGESRYWESRIEKVGSERAYAEFADAVNGLTPRKQHVAAHVFGETLYRTTSLREGVSVCDSRFTMGCYHALFGAAAQDIGTASFIEEMQTVCSGRSQGMERLCLHGVGHGILGSLGYDEKSLLRALDYCTRIPDGGNITAGCWGGVFMEYNVQTLISLDSPERALHENNAYEPCSALPDTYMPSCMFWQPTWWQIALSRNMDDITVFRRMGAMCERYDSQKGTDACIRGIGFRATWITGYRAAEVARLCGALDSVSGRISCWKQASADLRASDVRAHAPEVCTGLSGAQADACTRSL